jgi:hypothetical protein
VTITGTTAGGRGRVPLVAAATLGGLMLVSAAIQVPFSRLAHQSLLTGGGSLPSPFTLAYGAVGFVVAWRKPANPLGWLLLAVAAFGSVSEAASFYNVADYRLHGGGLPLGWVAVLVQPGWAPSIVLLGLIILLFPDGQLPSRRWRWLAGVYLMLGAVWLTAAFVLSASQIIAHRIRVDSGGNLLVLGTSSAAPSWWVVMQNLATVAFVVSSLASLAAQAVSYRRSSGERRQQLKWLLAGAAAGLAGLLLTFLLGHEGGLAGLAASLLAAAGVLALPVCMGVAILRYRLYDIDRLISRTLGYALVTGLLVGVYAGLVLLATEVLRFSSTWAVAASTLAAAALFSPVRRRVQRVVDRRFNRARYDADQTVAAFADRLRDAVDLGAVRDDLAATAQAALQPAGMSVWVRETTWGTRARS